MTDKQLAERLKAHGIVNPWWTLEAAHKANMYIWVAVTNLQLESGLGHNVFGHDPTSSIPESWKGSRVTKWKYLYYKARRNRGLQGVGPCQLTSASLQDRADRLGGCWQPLTNMTVGFGFLHSLIKQYGSVQLGFQHYNGSGPAAERYGRMAKALCDEWKKVLS